ncbi:MAG: carbohydrate kinase [Mariniblastus sp.]
MNSANIIAVGEVLWDLFPDGARFGGAPANFACHAARLGANVTIASAIGDDDQGQTALEILQSFGIDTQHVQIDPTFSTGRVNVLLDSNGKPTFEIDPDAAWDHLRSTPALEECAANSDAIYFGTLAQRNPQSRTAMRKLLKAVLESKENPTIQRILDINLRPPFCCEASIRESVHLASVLKMSDEELDQVCSACEVFSTGDHETRTRQLLLDYDLDRVVVTRGPKGAFMVTKDGIFSHPGIATRIIDTVGAGDAFTAGLVVGILDAMPDDSILRYACSIAAKACSHAGGVPLSD